MGLTWLEKMMHFFDAPVPVLDVETKEVLEKLDDTPPLMLDYNVAEQTDLQKVRAKFNEKTDILVVSEEYMKTINDEDRQWVESLLNIVIYFSGNSLINIGVVTAPNYYSGYRA